jgi:hypothetical protein
MDKATAVLVQGIKQEMQEQANRLAIALQVRDTVQLDILDKVVDNCAKQYAQRANNTLARKVQALEQITAAKEHREHQHQQTVKETELYVKQSQEQQHKLKEEIEGIKKTIHEIEKHNQGIRDKRLVFQNMKDV